VPPIISEYSAITFGLIEAVDFRSKLYLAVHQYPVDVTTNSLLNYSGKCGVFVWNRISPQLGGVDFIELPGVREIKKIYTSTDGVIKLITISNGGITQLRMFGYNDSGGVVFPVMKTLGIGGFPQYPDGLTISGDKAIWQGQDGNIYSESGNVVTQLYQIKTQGTTSTTTLNNISSGITFYGNGNETSNSGFRSNKQGVFLSYSTTGVNTIKKIYPFDITNGSNSAQSIHQGDVYTGVVYLPMSSVLKNIRIYNLPTSSSSDTTIATVKVYFNQSSTVGVTKTITLKEASRGYVDLKLNKPYIHAVQLEIEWNNSTTLGVDTYYPSTAVISYEPTKSQSPDSD